MCVQRVCVYIYIYIFFLLIYTHTHIMTRYDICYVTVVVTMSKTPRSFSDMSESRAAAADLGDSAAGSEQLPNRFKDGETKEGYKRILLRSAYWETFRGFKVGV